MMKTAPAQTGRGVNTVRQASDVKRGRTPEDKAKARTTRLRTDEAEIEAEANFSRPMTTPRSKDRAITVTVTL